MEPETIQALGGRHRHFALEKAMEQVKKELTQMQAQATLLEGKKKRNDAAENKLQDEILEKEESVDRMGEWLVAFYDSEKAQADNGRVAKFLSQNQSKHLYLETTVEKMVAMLQKIMAAEDEGAKEKKERMLTEAIQAGSKMSGFFHNRAAVELYLRLMRLPRPYQQMEGMSITWVQDNFRGDWGGLLIIAYNWGLNILENIFSPSAFAGTEEVRDLIKKIKACSRNDYDKNLAPLIQLYMKLLEPATPDSTVLNSDVIDELDSAYLTHVAAHAMYLGTRHPAYVESLERYKLAVNDILLDIHDAFKENGSADEKAVCAGMSMKYSVASMALGIAEFHNMPLLTPSVYADLAATWSKQPYAIREISSWFDPLVWYNKTMTHSHDMADFSATMFKAIQMTPSLSTRTAEQAAKAVAAELMRARAEILQLDSYLRDTSNRRDRVAVKQDMERIFSSLPSKPNRSGAKAEDVNVSAEIIEAERDFQWMRRALSKHIGGDMEVAKYIKIIQDEMLAVVKSASGEPSRAMTKKIGGLALFRSVWQPKSIHPQSRSREFPLMIKCAISEALAVMDYRETLLDSLPLVAKLRTTLAKVISDRMRPQTIMSLDGPLPCRKYSYWDNIELLPDNANLPITLEIEDALTGWEIARQIGDDKNAIQRMVHSIEHSPLSRLSDNDNHRKFVTLEIAQAIDHLIAVLNVNSSRRRLRLLNGHTALMNEDAIQRIDVQRMAVIRDKNTREGLISWTLSEHSATHTSPERAAMKVLRAAQGNTAANVIDVDDDQTNATADAEGKGKGRAHNEYIENDDILDHGPPGNDIVGENHGNSDDDHTDTSDIVYVRTIPTRKRQPPQSTRDPAERSFTLVQMGSKRPRASSVGSDDQPCTKRTTQHGKKNVRAW